MPQRIVSLEIGDTELKAAVLQTSFRDYKVAGLYRAPLNGAPAEEVKSFVAAHAADGDTILSALPGDLVTWRTFFLPFRDQKKLSQTVPFELENNVPFGLDEVIVDYQVLQRDGSGSTVLAALVPKEDLERHLELLQLGGVDPKVVDVGPLAALNVLTLVPDLAPTFIFLDFGTRMVTVALYREKTLVGLRTLARLPAGETNGASAPAGDGGEDLIGDVRWTLLALNGAPIEDGLPCYIAGDPALLDTLEAPLAAALGGTVRRLDRVDLRNLTPELVAQAPAFTSSLGLALREISPGAALGLNFRKGEFTFHRSQQELRRGLRTVALLGVVVLVLTVLDMFVKYQQLRQHAGAVDAQIQRVFAATLPDLGRPPNPKGVLADETETLRQRVELVTDIVPVSTSTSIDILRAAASAVPTKIRIDCDEWTMDPDEVRVTCNTETYDSVDAIREGMLKTGMFRDVEVKGAKIDPKGGVDFRMNLKLNKAVRPSGDRR